MMKDLLKKKMQHVINLHVHVGDKSNDDKEKQKESDLAPDVDDKPSPTLDHNQAFGPALSGGEVMQNAVPMHSGPQADDDVQRMQILQDMGAHTGSKNLKGVRAKAMHAAGQELDKLKAKKSLKKT